MQSRDVNSNAAVGVFLAFTTVQQMMTELSGAVTEKGKVAVITKPVFRLLKNDPAMVHGDTSVNFRTRDF
jgi:hypothetical protein